jgi:ribosome maturation factor RimP
MVGRDKQKRGCVPRFVVVRGHVNLVEAFEGAAGALPFEEEFRDIEVVAHRARREGRGAALLLTVDKPGGVDLETCGRIAAHLNASLAAQADPYTLEVESAGLDRPLLRPQDYDRFRDRDVLIKTTLPIESEYSHRGKLLGVRGNAVILERPKGELPIPLEMVKSANVEYDFRADLRRAKKEKREKR